VLEVSTRLRLSDSGALTHAMADTFLRQNLDDFMAHLSAQLSRISPVLTQTYFIHVQAPHKLLSSVQPDAPGAESYPPV